MYTGRPKLTHLFTLVCNFKDTRLHNKADKQIKIFIVVLFYLIDFIIVLTKHE